MNRAAVLQDDPLHHRQTQPGSHTVGAGGGSLARADAAGGLRVVSVGLVPDLSCEAAKRAALGAGAKIVGHFSYKLTSREIKEIESITQHDLIAYTTSVAEHVGHDSRYVHWGHTTTDVIDSARGLQLKQASEKILTALDDLRKAIKERAMEHRKTLMMGRTHGVHAEVTTFGMKLAVWYDEMRRNLERMDRTNALELMLGDLEDIATKIIERYDEYLDWKSCPPPESGTDDLPVQYTSVVCSPHLYEEVVTGDQAHFIYLNDQHPKTADRVVAVSDGTMAGGLPDGTKLSMWGHRAEIRAGSVFLEGTETLAGSAITLLDAFRNLAEDFDVATAVRLCCVNPRIAVGIREEPDLWVEMDSNLELTKVHRASKRV